MGITITDMTPCMIPIVIMMIVELVKGHFNPKPSAIVQRFRFNTRVRQQGESVARICRGSTPTH